MIKLLGYIYYRFFSDGRKLALLALLLCLNLVSMYFALEIVPVTEYGEMFGKDGAYNRQSITDTVENAEEFYDNISFVYSIAEHDLKHAQGLFAEYDQNIITIYNSLRESIEFPDGNFTSSRFFLYNFDAAFIAAAAVLFAATIYTEDSALGLPLLVRTTKRGRNYLNIARQTALLIFTFTCTGFFIFIEFLVFGERLSFNAPVQTLPGMALCPYPMNIAQYLMVTYLTKSLMTALYIFICLFIIRSSENMIFCCGFSVVIGFLSVAASLISPASIFSVTNYIGIYKLFCVSPLFSSYAAVAIGNRLYPAIPVVYAASLILLATLFTTYIFIDPVNITKNQRVPEKKHVYVSASDNYSINITKKSKPRVISKPLFVHELYKCIYSTGVWVIITFAIIVSVYSAITSQVSELSANELAYHGYIEYYSGDTVAESLQTSLKTEDIYVTAGILEKKKELWYNAGKDFSAGIINLEEYDGILTECADAVIKRDAFRRVETYDKYLSKRQDAGFVYDTGWNELFLRDIDLSAYIAALLVSVGIFMIECEYRSSAYGFDVILRTTKRGRRETLRNKLCVLALCCLVLSAISESVSILSIMSSYPLPLMRASADSLMIFAKTPKNFTIIGMFILEELSKILGLAAFSFLFAGLSYIIKNRLAAVICGISILLLFQLVIGETVKIMSLYYNILTLSALAAAMLSVRITCRRWL